VSRLVVRSLHSSSILRRRYGDRKSLRASKGRLRNRRRQLVAYANGRWAEGHKLHCTNRRTDFLQQLYYLTNTNRSKCPEVSISHSPMPFLEKSLNSTDAFWKRLGSGGGLVIVNQGVHCEEPGCVTKHLRRYAESIMPTLRSHGWETMFRETEHQHFATSTGYYSKGVVNLTSRPCRAIVNNSDYRTDELHELVGGLPETIPIIALEEATRPLHNMHGFDVERSKYDCTHYTFTLWKNKVTWQGMLEGLQTNFPDGAANTPTLA